MFSFQSALIERKLEFYDISESDHPQLSVKMAFQKIKMISASTESEAVEVHYTWNIRSISFILQFTEPVYSSSFKVIKDSNWSCVCCIKQKDGYVHLGLLLKADYWVTKIPVEFQFSLHGPSKGIKKTYPNCVIYNKENMVHYWTTMLTKPVLLEYKSDPGDVLTTVCRIRVLCKSPVNNFPISVCTMQHDLKTILKDSKFADVSLVIGEHRIKAHKVILAARSPVFAAMFSVDMLESNQHEVTITDMEYDVAKQLLDFIYTGEVEGEPRTVDGLLVAADKYGLERLKEICEQTLSKTIGCSTAIKTLIFADRTNAQHLKSYTMAFINANMSAVMASDDWKTMTIDRPDLLIEVINTLKNNT